MTHAVLRRLSMAFAAFFVWGALSAVHLSTRASAAAFPANSVHSAYER